MKKKESVFVIAILVCICILGCSNNSDGSADNNTVAGNTVITSIEDMLSVQDFSGSFDYEYVFETDCQSNISEYEGKVYTPDGYYTLEYDYSPPSMGDCYLMYYDYATEQFVYVCGKSNCEHNDSSCDAYMDEWVYPLHYLWYYEGYLYTVMMDGDYICVCKISPDGSTRENVCKVLRLTIEITEEADGSVSEARYYPHMWQHRGYIYYSTTYGNSSLGELGRIKLDGTGEAETICSFAMEGEDAEAEIDIYRVKPYGQYIFFQMGYYNETDSKYNLYVYDTESNDNIKKVCDDCSGDYLIINNKIYYYSYGDIYVKDIDSGKVKLFFDVDTENTYTFSANHEIFAYDDYFVIQLTDEDHDGYDEETNTEYEYVYQLIINQDGELVQTLQPDDEKLNPY